MKGIISYSASAERFLGFFACKLKAQQAKTRASQAIRTLLGGRATDDKYAVLKEGQAAERKRLLSL